MLESSSAPLIGLPARMDPGTERQYLISRYADAVRGSGGVPIILPLLERPVALRPVAESLDGILLTGAGTDVDPARYGAEVEEGCGPIQPLHEAIDFFLLDIACRRKTPVLAICFGMQSLNVFMGGTLVQDIPSAVQTPIRHSCDLPEGRPSHAIRIVHGSFLEELAGGLEAQVNSTHHQAVGREGDGLEIIARAPDGVVESVVGRSSDHWILGVQWHPEKSFMYDVFSKNILDSFLARCRAARGNHD